VDGHKISFSLGAWFSCVEQKVRQEGFFFNLGCTGREASCCRGKLSAVRQRAFSVIFSGGLSDSSSNSGTGVEARHPKITLQTLL